MKLASKHLFTLSLNVDPSQAYQIGAMSNGRRVIVPITGGSFSGEHLSGVVEPGGYDWAFFRKDGVMEIDVRLVLHTEHQELIYLTYRGRLLASPDVHKRMAKGGKVDEEEYSLTTVVEFETSVEKIDWLNNVIAVGVGRQQGYQPTYEVYEIGRR